MSTWLSAVALLPLGLDTFVLATAAGMMTLHRRDRWRLTLLFALVEGGAPAVGLALGHPLSDQLDDLAGYAAAAVLVGLGLLSLLGEDDHDAERLVRARGVAMILLCLSVGLDELALGFTFGLLALPVVPLLVILGTQAVVLSQLGFALGGRLSERTRESAGRVSGVGLVVVGLALLVLQLG